MPVRIVTYDPATKTVTQHQRGVGLDDDQKTIAVFLLARLVGHDTSRAIADELGITMAAANKRVYRLRQRGLLPPARSQENKS